MFALEQKEGGTTEPTEKMQQQRPAKNTLRTKIKPRRTHYMLQRTQQKHNKHQEEAKKENNPRTTQNKSKKAKD